MRVPWTARRSNQSLLKEINTEYSLEGLKLQYYSHEMQRADSVEKTLMLGRASLVVQLVKNPPAMWETWVQSLGWEDPLEKGKATHSSIVA